MFLYVLSMRVLQPVLLAATGPTVVNISSITALDTEADWFLICYLEANAQLVLSSATA